MSECRRPGALLSHRAGEIVFGETTPLSITSGRLQIHQKSTTRVIVWKVTRWLGVEAVQVRR